MNSPLTRRQAVTKRTPALLQPLSSPTDAASPSPRQRIVSSTRRAESNSPHPSPFFASMRSAATCCASAWSAPDTPRRMPPGRSCPRPAPLASRVTPEPNGFRTDALRVTLSADQRLAVSTLDGEILQRDAAPAVWDGSSFRVTKEKTPEDHFFGLGGQNPVRSIAPAKHSPCGTPTTSAGRNRPIPFTSRSPSSSRCVRAAPSASCSTTPSALSSTSAEKRADRYSFSAPDGPQDYYLLYGPDPKQVLTTYAWLTGPSPLPPLWALGYQQSRYTYSPRAQLEEIASRMRADRIPCDVLWLDIDFQYKNRPFTVDPARFPEFFRPHPPSPRRALPHRRHRRPPRRAPP